MNELREWGKGYNYPYGALVLYTEDKELMKTLNRRDGLSGTSTYSSDTKDVAWDLIFPKTPEKKYNYRLKSRLLAQCE